MHIFSNALIIVDFGYEYDWYFILCLLKFLHEIKNIESPQTYVYLKKHMFI